jgi:uncharacterized membrane protein
MALGVLHVALGFVKFEEPWRAMAAVGFYNIIDGDPQRRAAVWFTLFGVLVLVLGLAVRALERLGATRELRTVGIALLVLTFAGVLLMPTSGFWALYPAVLALVIGGADATPVSAAANPATAPTSAPGS